MVTLNVSRPDNRVKRLSQRKVHLVDLGLWALTTGRGWLVHAVHAALVREGLAHE
jgi:hypothetical protein